MREIHIDNNRLLNVKANTLLYDGSGLYVLGVHDVTDVDETGYPLSTMIGEKGGEKRFRRLSCSDNRIIYLGQVIK